MDGTPVDPIVAAGCVHSMHRRGPDDEGVLFIDSSRRRAFRLGTDHTDQRLEIPRIGTAGFDAEAVSGCDVALAQARLSILDLSPAGHQPMSCPDDECHVTFNGEVFNYRSLRDELSRIGHRFSTGTDTEVVLAAYREWGESCFNKFNGMWAMAIFDVPKRRLLLCRDRFGVKPLVYCDRADRFSFASDCLALLRDPRTPCALDPEAIHHYLSMTVVPAPLTAFQAIRRLPPGHLLELDESGLRIRRWYSLDSVGQEPLDDHEAAERLDDLLSNAVALRLHADVPVGAFLSGGVDSSLVSAMAARSGSPKGRLRTFTISFPGAGALDESRHAWDVARHIRAKPHVYELAPDFPQILRDFASSIDEPFASPSALGVYLLSREASREIKVVLTGDGGDEACAGYWSRHAGIDRKWDGFARKHMGWLRSETAVNGWPDVAWKDETLVERLSRRYRFERLPDQALRDRHYLRTIAFAASEAEKRLLYTRDWADQCVRYDTDAWLAARLPAPGGDRVERWQRFDISTTLADEMLAKADRATMAWGIEARTPLLDYRVVEHCLSLPASSKVDGDGNGKLVLKRVARKYLPAEILDRPKQGFTLPLSQWFKGEMAPLLSDTLSPSALARHGILDGDSVAGLLALHRGAPSERVTALLYSALFLQLWLDARKEPANAWKGLET